MAQLLFWLATGPRWLYRLALSCIVGVIAMHALAPIIGLAAYVVARRDINNTPAVLVFSWAVVVSVFGGPVVLLAWILNGWRWPMQVWLRARTMLAFNAAAPPRHRGSGTARVAQTGRLQRTQQAGRPSSAARRHD